MDSGFVQVVWLLWSCEDCSLPVPPAPPSPALVLSAGNTMTVSYMTGLTLGSAVAYCTYSLTRHTHSSCFHTSTTNTSFSAGL